MNPLHLLWIIPLSGSLGALAVGFVIYCARKDEAFTAQKEEHDG